jgi:hypothetical protein
MRRHNEGGLSGRSVCERQAWARWKALFHHHLVFRTTESHALPGHEERPACTPRNLRTSYHIGTFTLVQTRCCVFCAEHDSLRP